VLRKLLVTLALAALATAAVPSALGHPERSTEFPTGAVRTPPKYRNTGTALVVCQADSAQRLRKIFRSKDDEETLERRLKELKSCKYRSIQDAVDAAKSGYRLRLMPGLYTEPKSRAVPVDDPRCKDMYEVTDDPSEKRTNDPGKRPTFEYQLKCKNSKNLVQVIGDKNNDRKCDQLCDLQIEGLGAKPLDVLVSSDREKLDVIRADRVENFVISNLAVEFGAFNGVDVVETDGFQVNKVVARYNQNYGVLTFTTVNGVYRNIDAYGNGDSGVYPGSTKPQDCSSGQDGARYSIEIRNVTSHDNVLGYSGTAGDSVWVHDSKFFNNATGLTTDSFAAGHPGMPQRCAKWEGNQIYDNNAELFSDERDKYCQENPFSSRRRDPKIVCPQFQTAQGTGALIGGGTNNLLIGNRVWGNRRGGFVQFWVPAALRGESDPAKQNDTSNGNRYINNKMGVKPDGTVSPNGNNAKFSTHGDFWWDEQGQGNCYQGNTGADGGKPTSVPATLPSCPGSSLSLPGRPEALPSIATCATWDPGTRPDPPGCDWFVTPPAR
jgi:hypothetical protein